jgi:hypothetical protein
LIWQKSLLLLRHRESRSFHHGNITDALSADEAGPF